MYTKNLRRVGRSIMLTRPPAILELVVDGERLVVDPKVKPRYTLDELLSVSDYSRTQPPEEREWIDAPIVGGELL